MRTEASQVHVEAIRLVPSLAWIMFWTKMSRNIAIQDSPEASVISAHIAGARAEVAACPDHDTAVQAPGCRGILLAK